MSSAQPTRRWAQARWAWAAHWSRLRSNPSMPPGLPRRSSLRARRRRECANAAWMPLRQRPTSSHRARLRAQPCPKRLRVSSPRPHRVRRQVTPVQTEHRAKISRNSGRQAARAAMLRRAPYRINVRLRTPRRALLPGTLQRRRRLRLLRRRRWRVGHGSHRSATLREPRAHPHRPSVLLHLHQVPYQALRRLRPSRKASRSDRIRESTKPPHSCGSSR